MRAAVILFCSWLFVVTLYTMAYVTHTCTTEWYCGANMIMLVIAMLASILGVLHAMIEMR